MVHYPDKRDGYFDALDDIRTLKFLARAKLGNQAYTDLSSDTAKSKSEIRALLDEYLSDNFGDTPSRVVGRDQLMEIARNNLLPLERFEWIEENKEACSVIYYRITNTTNSELLPFDQTNLLVGPSPGLNLFHQLSLNTSPNSHSQRMERIRTFFDTWQSDGLSKQKWVLINNLRLYWTSTSEAFKKISWLTDADEDACEWAWRYLHEYHNKEFAEKRPGILMINQFSPNNTTEKYLAIYTVLLLWQPHVAEKILLLKNIKKAWSERQRRRDQEGKKAINTFVSTEVKQKLDHLASLNQCQLKDMLTMLINEEYARRRDEIKAHLSL